MEDFDEQDRSVASILGTNNLDVNRKKLGTYLKYLKRHIELPCELTGIEDFEWEEFYIWGPGNKKEYEKLRKTNPSYKDKFILIDFVNEIDDDMGIFVKIQRVSDKRKFMLPLADVEATNKKSKNHQLLDDYSVWFINYR